MKTKLFAFMGIAAAISGGAALADGHSALGKLPSELQSEYENSNNAGGCRGSVQFHCTGRAV